MKPKITIEMIKLAQACLIAQAYKETIAPIVNRYQKKVLRECQFTNKGELEKLGDRFPEIKERLILDPKESYLLSEDDFNIYHKKIKSERDKAKLFVEDDDFCPLLVAEDNERKAKRLFLQAMQPISRINPDNVYQLELYKKLYDLNIRLVVTYCKDNKIKLEG